MNHGTVVYRGLLVFKDVLLTEDFVLKIYELLDNPNSIQRVNVDDASNCHHEYVRILSLDEEEAYEEGQRLASNPATDGITGLDFWSCPLEDNASIIQMLSDVIMVFSETVHLQKLYFSNNSLCDDHLQILCDGLIYLYDLRELRIVSNDITYSAFDILSDAFSNDDSGTNHNLKHNLQILDLSDNVHLFDSHSSALLSFESFVCSVLMDRECNLQTFRLVNVSGLCSQHIDILSRWIATEHCTLQTLDFSQNECDLPMIQSLCKCINQTDCGLSALILNHCTFTRASAQYLGSNLSSNHTLDMLALNGMALFPFMEFAKSAERIRVRRLLVNELAFRTADNWYDLEYGAISDVIVHLISVKCPFLEQFHIDGGDLHNDEVNDMSAFLGTMPWIRKVSLRNNRLSHGCCKKLSHAVKQSQKTALKQTNLYCKVMVECIEQYVNVHVTSDYSNNGAVGELNRFTEDVAYVVVEYLFQDPLDGLKCILLQGNGSIHSQFTANFRNCSLLDAKILSKLSKTRWDGQRSQNSMSHMKHKQLQWSKLLV